MNFLKKYKTWEIVVALLPPLFVVDRCWHLIHDEYPSTLYKGVLYVIDLAYCAILIYSLFCMYRGARQSGRFPKLMLLLLIAVTARQLYLFVPQPEYDIFDTSTSYYIYSGISALLSLFYTVVVIIAIIRMFKEKLTVLAVTYICMALAIPLLSTLVYMLMPISFANQYPNLPVIVAQIFFMLTSLCYSVLFLCRNNFYKPDIDADYHG